jgi:Ca2+-binding RTX toxin-like protein
MATPSQITALKQLYTGIFGFLPTTEAFDWYVAQIDRLGLDTAGLANVLLYDDLQAGASNTFDYSGGDTAFVRQVYQNLFGWTDTALALPEHVEGVAYWTEQLNGIFGGDKGKLIEAMIWVVETTGLNSPDISTQQAFALLQNYLEVSTYALEQAKAAGEDLDLDVLRSAYDVVTGNAASVVEAKTLIDTRGKAIYGTDAGETLNGTYRNDAILALDGDDVINAGAGNDWINTGYSGNNVVTGGKGNDEIEGGPQDDVYIFNRGDGQDVVFDHGGNDTLQLNGIPAADVALARQGDDLVLSVKGSADQITVYSHFANDNYAIDSVRFADGTIWDKSDISNAISGGGQVIQGTDGDDALHGGAGNDTLNGGAGHDQLFGEAGNDVLNGGKGDDWIYGGEGDDVYLFARGDGQDKIREEYAEINKDTIRFAEGIAPEDVQVRRSDLSTYGNDLILSLKDSTDQITVRNHFFGEGYAIEAIEFADGTVWDKTYINDVLVLQSTDGDDTLYTNDNVHTLSGGLGNDTLIGGSSSDEVLNGGKGNDWLEGWDGNDTYLFARGDGQDTIQEWHYYWYGASDNKDTIQFAEGITPDDVQITRSGTDFNTSDNNLILSLKGSADQITVWEYFHHKGAVIETVQFADGTVWDLPQIVGSVLGLPEPAL